MQEPPFPPQPPPPLPQSQPPRRRGIFAPIAVAAAALAKMGPFIFPFLKSGAWMLISLYLYARVFGWPFAVGFVVLIFIHEMGHVIAIRMMGLKASLPVFIPFAGAVIFLKENPQTAWVEAIIGIGGPLLGSIGATLMGAFYFPTGNPIFLALGYFGCLINLFNLIPIIPLDGGRISAAISPKLWIVGLLILVPYLIYRLFNGGLINSAVTIIILFIVLRSLPRVIALFRNRTPAQTRYFECTPQERITMAALYFGLMIALYLEMQFLKQTIGPGNF